MNTEAVGIITARGGSKGLPGKNIKPLAGKPLIAWSIEAALQSSRLDRVIVSSDDEDILRISRELGAEVICMGHHGAVTGAEDVRTFFGRMIAATEQYHGRIIEAARAGKSVREIAEALGAEIHAKSKLLPPDFFQKNCALLVKQSLKHEGIGE